MIQSSTAVRTGTVPGPGGGEHSSFNILLTYHRMIPRTLLNSEFEDADLDFDLTFYARSLAGLHIPRGPADPASHDTYHTSGTERPTYSTAVIWI